MTLHEPATFFTDLLLAVLGAWFALRLRDTASPSPARTWWIAALSLMAASAFAGGFYHGFAPEVPARIEAWWWRGVLWIICGLGFAMGMSLLREFLPEKAERWRYLLIAKFAISCTVVAWTPGFIVAIADYGAAMLAWALAGLLYRPPWRGPMLAGIGLSLMAAVIQQSQRGLTERINHNDLFHVVQAFALFAFYRAGCYLGERRPLVRAIHAKPPSGRMPSRLS
jgi:MFS family permease